MALWHTEMSNRSLWHTEMSTIFVPLWHTEMINHCGIVAYKNEYSFIVVHRNE